MHHGSIFNTPAVDATFRPAGTQDQHDSSLKPCLHVLLSAVPDYCGSSQIYRVNAASAQNHPRARQALYPSGLVIHTASCILTGRCVKGFSRDEGAYSTFCVDLVVVSGRTCNVPDRYGSCFMVLYVCFMMASSLWNCTDLERAV